MIDQARLAIESCFAPGAPYFIISLCLTPGYFTLSNNLLVKGRALTLNGLTGLSADVSR
jgi:hypothetical protein